jgi:hypothetical protein
MAVSTEEAHNADRYMEDRLIYVLTMAIVSFSLEVPRPIIDTGPMSNQLLEIRLWPRC